MAHGDNLNLRDVPDDLKIITCHMFEGEPVTMPLSLITVTYSV